MLDTTSLEPKIHQISDGLLFSTRNKKGKYLQSLVLELARTILPAIPSDADSPYARISLRYTEDQSCLIFRSVSTKPGRLSLAEREKGAVTLLADALLRQIARLTGARGFELSTWSSPLLTQPVELMLLSASGSEVRMFNRTSSANRVYHGIVELSDQLDEHLGTPHRTASDLDIFLDAGSSIAWSIHRQAARSGSKAFASPDPRITAIELPAGQTAASEVRAAYCMSTLPGVLRRLDDYEASLARATTYRTSRWGQDDTLATARTERRAANLSPDLSAGIKPLSRSMKETSEAELMALAKDRPLTHLAIEFGISEAAIRKRLKKAGWVSPRAWGR